jgi:hypothetical protein
MSALDHEIGDPYFMNSVDYGSATVDPVYDPVDLFHYFSYREIVHII